MEATASKKERILFLNDVSMYKCSPHPNILQLLGRSLDTIPMLVLQEYIPNGDLKKYLKSQKNAQQHFLNSDYPLLWSYQLTSGLKHLHENGCVHPWVSRHKYTFFKLNFCLK